MNIKLFTFILGVLYSLNTGKLNSERAFLGVGLIALRPVHFLGLAVGDRTPDEALATATNTANGVRVGVTFRSGMADFTLTLSNETLTTACGGQYQRCPRLDVLTFEVDDNASQLILIIPLVGKLQLLEFIHEVQGPQFNLMSMAEISIADNCNPMRTFMLRASYYTVCAGGDDIYVFELIPNRTAISQSQFLRNMGPVPSLQPTSNLVCIEEFDSIYFASGTDIYAIQPITGTIPFNGMISDSSCTVSNGTTLLAGDTGDLLVYCDSNMVYYHIPSRDWRRETETGHFEYLCGDDVVITVVTNQSQTAQMAHIESSSGQRYNVSLTDFDSATCFGEYFALSYESGGLIVLELTTGTVEQYDTDACASTGCKPLLVFNGDYFIVPSIGVFSDSGNESAIIIEEITGDLSFVLTSLQSVIPEITSPATSDTPATVPGETTTAEPNRSIVLQATLIPIAILGVIAIILCAAIIVW